MAPRGSAPGRDRKGFEMMFGKVVRRPLEWELVGENGARFVLPISSSVENLSDYCGSSVYGAVVMFGDLVLVAAFNGFGVAAAVYEFSDEDEDIEARVSLIWLGDEIHKDAGHALEACFNWCRHN